MPTVYHIKTGERRNVDSVDARELIETGRWSHSPKSVKEVEPAVKVEPVEPVKTKGGK